MKLEGSLDIIKDLTVDTNTLVTDSANNRVGIGKTPAKTLDVLGDAKIDGDFSVDTVFFVDKSSAFIGVNQLTPAQMLHVEGGNILVSKATIPRVILKDSNSTGITHTGVVGYQDNGGVERAFVGFGSASDETFSISNNYSSATAHINLRVNASAGVAIGFASNPSPQEKLHVDGNGRFDGRLVLLEEATPTTPALGLGTLYSFTDGTIHYKNDSGVDFDLTTGGGSSEWLQVANHLSPTVAGTETVSIGTASQNASNVLTVSGGTHITGLTAMVGDNTITGFATVGTATQQESDVFTVVGDSSFKGFLTFDDTSTVDADALRLHQEDISGVGRLTFEGTTGGLLTIIDDKDNELWTASDISGNPIGYIDADWLVQFGNPFARPFSIRYDSGTGLSKINNILPEYADVPTADADAALLSGDLYKLTGDRTVYQRP